MVHGSRIGQHMSPLAHQAGGVLQPLLTSSEDVRRRARRVQPGGIATPPTHNKLLWGSVGMKISIFQRIVKVRP
jgi:hypothetical protein